MERYSAKLLFQWRVTTSEGEGVMRRCEERIVNYEARGDRDALRKAKAMGKAAQWTNLNSSNDPVHFEFIGVRDMLKVGSYCGPHEVWYDIKTYRLPMERKDHLIPSDEKLLKRL